MVAKYTRPRVHVTQVARCLTGIMQSNDTMVQLLCIRRATNLPAMNATVTIPDLVSPPVCYSVGMLDVTEFSWIIIVAAKVIVANGHLQLSRFSLINHDAYVIFVDTILSANVTKLKYHLIKQFSLCIATFLSSLIDSWRCFNEMEIW